MWQTERQQSKEYSVLPALVLHSWRPLFLLPAWGSARAEQESERHQHMSIIGSSWVIPNQTQGRVLRAGQSHSDVFQQLACCLCEDAKLKHLCPVSLPPTQMTLHQAEGGAPLLESGPRAIQLPVPLPQVVMNCRELPLRGVRTISIKHNFLM